MSSKSLLAVLTPARDLRTLPQRLPLMVSERLHRLGVTGKLIDLERAAMTPVEIGRTKDRSVLGSMVDFAKLIPHSLPEGEWDMTSLRLVEAKLLDTPCRVTSGFDKTIWPDRTTRQLLEGKWLA